TFHQGTWRGYESRHRARGRARCGQSVHGRARTASALRLVHTTPADVATPSEGRRELVLRGHAAAPSGVAPARRLTRGDGGAIHGAGLGEQVGRRPTAGGRRTRTAT